jgi:hypothetical protein
MVKRHIYEGPDAGTSKPSGYLGPYHGGHGPHQTARESPVTGYPRDPDIWDAGDQLPSAAHSWAPGGGRDLPTSDHSDGKPVADLGDCKPVRSYSER